MASPSKRKHRVAELMAVDGLSATQAAECVGVRPKTVRLWLRSDVDFRADVETWRTGPPVDETTLAQSRRMIIDEFARRVLYERSTLSVRELLNIYDRLLRESAVGTEERIDDQTHAPSSGTQLTPEQAERIWAEIDRELRATEDHPADEPTQS